MDKPATFMRVPFHRTHIDEDEINAAVEVLRSGWITMGERTFEFEREFARYIGAKHAVALNSGTAALHLALKCLGVRAGDEIIIPAYTFVATAEVVLYFNAIPVLVDVDPDTHLLTAADIAPKITPRTRAVIPVHFSGQPADMDEIMSLAEAHGIAVIEDAAHSLPAKYKGRMIGTIGDLTCFSFYATKTLTTGEGGLVATENDEWADLLRVLRLHGISKDAWNRYSDKGTWRYDVVEAGYKYNMTDINAALGLGQLARLEENLEKRKVIARSYDDAFEGNEALTPYRIKPDRESARHLYPLRLNLDALKIDRDRFFNDMRDRGVGLSVHFIPLYRFTYYEKMGLSPSAFPNCEWAFQRTVSLPLFPGMTPEQTAYVIDNVRNVLKENRR